MATVSESACGEPGEEMRTFKVPPEAVFHAPIVKLPFVLVQQRQVMSGFVTQLTGVNADEMQQVAVARIDAVANDDEHHHREHEQAEQYDGRVDRHAGTDHRRVEPELQQDAQILVEVLHGNRAPRAHQHVTAMLQKRVHRHDEETGA
mgnify:CR=1 FL=1